ncbi:MAG: tRNA (adenosine(37)-N6)-threonylcarbamoyltransferase complex transferase subunit TsaD, partial [Candidatus Pacebacteria bacterium]|nr:tRNA (adenosine(37)-N6)-threonylcarbamoyltransferase complex transferase subunit TsaD [Candidatus Paceibacterota bacterium]
MKILGIDTSCDDTAIALLRAEGSEFEILSNIVSSQVELHKKYGGVYPFLAKREHQKNLPVVFKKSLGRRKPEEIDAIAVTSGPGLEPCLWQGINFAVDLAEKLKKPLIPVNHIEAHILANFIERDLESVKMPAVCLVVSGGHTSLFLMKKIGRYQLIGETRDDAAGECFDKVARILGMGYPGGPLIAKAAAEFNGKKSSVELPRPMIHQKNYNFSFSGLKTAVLYNYKSQPSKVRKSKEYIREMAFETQEAIID